MNALPRSSLSHLMYKLRRTIQDAANLANDIVKRSLSDRHVAKLKACQDQLEQTFWPGNDEEKVADTAAEEVSTQQVNDEGVYWGMFPYQDDAVGALVISQRSRLT